MNCSKHEKYKAIHKPKVLCIECWLMWLDKNPNATIRAKDLLAILLTLIASRKLQDENKGVTEEVKKGIKDRLNDFSWKLYTRRL